MCIFDLILCISGFSIGSLLVVMMRYLVLTDLIVDQSVYVVHKRIKLSVEKAIFIFIKNTLPPIGKYPVMPNDVFFFTFIAMILCTKSLVVASALMSAIYEENKDQDGFLYMTYNGENTFGSH